MPQVAMPKFINLPDVGIRGNGHLMMMERNNQQIAGLSSTGSSTTRNEASKNRLEQRLQLRHMVLPV
jgi:hypothetical protein